MKASALSFLMVLVLAVSSSAETHIGGYISGRLDREGSPYICDLDDQVGISIQEEDTLLIDSGVTIIFPARGGMDIWGVVIAEGTQEDSINFLSMEDPWYGIAMMDTNRNDVNIRTSAFTYCVFANWHRPDWLMDSIYGLFYLTNIDQRLIIQNCTFNGLDHYCPEDYSDQARNIIL